MSDTQMNEFWTVYRKLEESMGGVIGSVFDSDKIQSMLYDEISLNEPEDVIIEKMIQKMDEEYDKIMFMQEDDKDESDQTSGDVFDFKGVF